MKTQLRQLLVWGCIGWLASCPNYGVRSNTIPLTFGMTPEAASAALQNPLTFVAGGRHGFSIYYVEQTAVTTGFIVAERERLWMQFRGGRLTGWTPNWDRPMAW
jgi:hypothetical protein